MPLTLAERIGPYEIVGPLGKGGMGEVYRATDTRLGRDVALKLLDETAAQDSDLLARFERETRAVAALNHPNILAIHDTGTYGSVPYAVTELLEGETLGERLRAGPLAAKRAAEIACQIADGLAAAHAGGVIHRDIKPDNIFLTRDGRAKILDFGIARIERTTDRIGSLTGTRSRGSSAYILVGTAGYMSPEQVRGKPIDARTDIFSLGAVFFQMLTGRQAFSRDSAVETFGAVLKDDPSSYPEAGRIPPEISPFVFRCLEKDPADRYQSARDLLLDLRAHQAEALHESAARVQFRSEPPWRQRKKRVFLRAAAAALLFALGVLLGRQCGPMALIGAPADRDLERRGARGFVLYVAAGFGGSARVELAVEELQRARDLARHVRGISTQHPVEPLVEGAVAGLDEKLLLSSGEEARHHEQEMPAVARRRGAGPPAEPLEPDREVHFKLAGVPLGQPVLTDERRVNQPKGLPEDGLHVRLETIAEGESGGSLSADLHRPGLSDSFQ